MEDRRQQALLTYLRTYESDSSEHAGKLREDFGIFFKVLILILMFLFFFSPPFWATDHLVCTERRVAVRRDSYIYSLYNSPCQNLDLWGPSFTARDHPWLEE